MDYQALKAELLSGHPGTGAYSSDPVTAAAQLNEPNRTRRVVLTMRALREWSAENARALKVRQAIDNVALSEGVRNIALVADRLLGTDDGQLEPGNAQHRAMIDALVTAGVLVDADRTALLAKATVSISRAEEISLGERVLVGHVIDARRI